MARYAPAALVAALLVVTGLSFLQVESLKLELSPVRGTHVTKLFSPVCRCDKAKARIAFRLGKPDVVAVSILDSAGRDVRTLALGRVVRDKPVAFLWNGRDDTGAIVHDGFYHPRVRLDVLEKTFVLPDSIRVDTLPPRVRHVVTKPRVISPDGDGRGDRVVVGYALDQRAQAMLLVDGVRRVLSRPGLRSGQLSWYGRVDGSALPPGRHRLAVAAVDPAGNQSRVVDAGTVRIRYVEIDKPVVRARAGKRFTVTVSTDARRVHWLLAGRRGTGAAPRLRLRAPRAPGVYTLYVLVGDHAARTKVRVTP